MLDVSSMGHTLSLAIAYYYLEENKHLEQGNINRTGRFPLYSYPLVSTELDERIYLLESDQNIRVRTRLMAHNFLFLFGSAGRLCPTDVDLIVIKQAPPVRARIQSR